MIRVEFLYYTGAADILFTRVALMGSWDATGAPTSTWSSVSMTRRVGFDGRLLYQCSVDFPDRAAGIRFEWGVQVTTAAGTIKWGVPAEVKSADDTRCVRNFVVRVGGQREEYYLSHLSRRGALLHVNDRTRVRFSVWAPNAQAAAVVFVNPANGYVSDAGVGVVSRTALMRDAEGVWSADVVVQDIDRTIYMFELINDAGQRVYRTDLHSRCQVGSGAFDPNGATYTGDPLGLDGRVSASFIMDPRVVEDPIGSGQLVLVDQFWANEFTPTKPTPNKVSELIIYELHVGALGFGRATPGNLTDALELLPYLEELGVNAIELLPIQEFGGIENWGYSTSHFLAPEFSSGGPDQLKAIVKACHQRGFAVILDVVYNHYVTPAERAQWLYDSTRDERNIYYWYEGLPSDYENPKNGYIQNESSDRAPAFHEEFVRKVFIDNAVSLLLEFHVDGFRVDQVTSIHAYPHHEVTKLPAIQARTFGAKFLREWMRTVRLVHPEAMVIAEDHSGWEDILKPLENGGIGFDATWVADYYHHLIGDTNRAPELLWSAGHGSDGHLPFSHWAKLYEAMKPWHVVYHESHDECGNSEKDGRRSKRTMLVAAAKSHHTELTPDLRGWAEARCRTVAGLTLLGSGTPMFFMGEEVGATHDYRNSDWLGEREDLHGAKNTSGANLFKFYRDVIRLRRRISAFRSEHTKVLYTSDQDRVFVFKRWDDASEVMILASLSNRPWRQGYIVNHSEIPDARWKEIFSSDATLYGGIGYGNGGAELDSRGEAFEAVIPANGFVVFQRLF